MTARGDTSSVAPGQIVFLMSYKSAEPRGYLSVCQTPDGVIQLISSAQHYAFNLAWLKNSATSGTLG